MAANHSVTETLQSENNQLRQQIATLEQTIAELRQSRHMLQVILDNLPLAVAWKDQELIYQGCNRQFAQDANLASPAEIVGKSDLDLCGPEQAERQRAADRTVLTSGTAEYRREEAQNHGGESPAWFRVSRIPLCNGEETPCAILRIYEDITSDKQEELQLRIFKELAENTPDSISIAGMDGILTYTNPAFNTLFQQDLLKGNMSITDMLAPEELERLPAIMEEVGQRGFWQSVVQYQRVDGSLFPGQVSGFFVRDSNGNPQGMAAIIRDISEQVRQERDLRTFYAFAENAPDAFGMAKLDGPLIYANPAFHTMLQKDELVGTTFFDHIAPEDQAHLPEVIAEIEKNGIWQGKIMFQRADGTIFPTQASSFTVTDADGKTLVLAGTIRDLTEQIRAEEERAALQEQIIVAQQAALRELSTPLIPLADDLVAMPLIGSIDSARAQQILEALLQGVAEHQATTVIIDITGVQVVDTQVANALVRAAQAVKLLGAQVVLTGIRPEIAQTLVSMGADLAGIMTHGTLQTGIAYAMGQAARKDTRKSLPETDMALRQDPAR